MNQIKPLTLREHKIATYMIDGMSYKQISAEMSYSTRTIEYCAKSILKKLSITKRQELVLFINKQWEYNEMSTEKLYDYKGQSKTLYGWSAAKNISYGVLYNRIHNCGWSFAESIETPVRKRVKKQKDNLLICLLILLGTKKST